jgi:hypothetical protein
MMQRVFQKRHPLLLSFLSEVKQFFAQKNPQYRRTGDFHFVWQRLFRQKRCYIFFNSLGQILDVGFHEFFSYNVFVEFNVAIRHA